MYKVTSEGNKYYSDTLTYIRLHDNGCYVPCTKEQASGFCVKIPDDTVFRLSESSLKGDEPIGTVEEISAAQLMTEYEAALNTLGVETDEN